MKKMMTIVLLAGLLAAVPAGDRALAFKSALVPGMGQISAGEGSLKSRNTWKGLGLMCAFTLTLHGTLSQISLKENYAEATQNYEDSVRLYRRSGTYEQLTHAQDAWTEAKNNYDDANLWSFVFLGLTAAVYGYGIADALLFTRTDEKTPEGPASGLLPGRLRLALTRHDDRPGLDIRVRF